MAKNAPNQTLIPETTFSFPRPDTPLSSLCDVDDGTREVPVNMVFQAEGSLRKDYGVDNFGNLGTAAVSTIFTYQKKDGTTIRIKAEGTTLTKYDAGTSAYVPLQTEAAIAGTVAVTNGSAAVVGTTTVFLTALTVGQAIRIGTEYFYVSAIADDTHLTLSGNIAGVTASGLTLYKNAAPQFSAGTYFGFIVYNDIMYGGNAVNPFFTFDGTILTFFPSLPKGNIYEVFEDRLFVSGVVAEPLSIYYSDPAAATTFGSPSVLKPIGTDKVTGLINYYGTLVMLKLKSLWKMSFEYDQVAEDFLPKITSFNRSVGCAGPRAYCWVDNDVWFFTGTEVKAFGIRDQTTGAFGLDPDALSNQIKDSLETVSQTYGAFAVAFFQDSRFYLALPLNGSTYNNVVFVCNTLYKNAWTKLANRLKSSISDFDYDGQYVYSASADVLGRVYRWNTQFHDGATAIPAYVNFREITQADFSKTAVWRYLDVKFGADEGTIGVNLWGDAYDLRTTKSKTFFLSTSVEGEDNSLGEVDYGEELFGDAFGETITVPNFLARRISFLIKAQRLQVGLFNSTIDENITIAAWLVTALEKPRKQFSPSKIISI